MKSFFGNKFKIVFLATVFNLLFEFAFRGVAGLFSYKELFIPLLFLLYFSYFWIVEELILKYRITNKQLLVVAFTFGVLPMAFLTGALFAPPLVMGVNFVRLIFINIVWWGTMQGLITFYFANRIVKRDWGRPRMGKLGWWMSIGFIVAVHLLSFLRSPILPRGPLIGYLVVLIIVLLGVGYLKKHLTKSQQNVYQFEKSPILDFLSFGSVFVFLCLGIFVATRPILVEGTFISPLATRLATIWSYIVFLGVIIYYLKNKKQITI